MVTTPPQTKLTYEDYANTPEGERWELIDGELIMVAAPSEEHQIVVFNLAGLLYIFLRANPIGLALTAPRDVFLTENDIVQPDLLFVSNERAHIRNSGYVAGAPDLVVEVRSPSTARKDWITKRELYARHGVQEYWIADAEASTITVLTLAAGALQVTAVYGLGNTLLSPTLPGFTPAIDDIFRFEA